MGNRPVIAADEVAVALMEEEAARYFGNKGITTCTFFSGNSVSAAAEIKSKLCDMLIANPWVAGRLATKTVLVHPQAGGGHWVDSIFTVKHATDADCVKITPTASSFEDLTNACWPLGVPDGDALVETGARVTRCILVAGAGASSPADGFALIFSMSHIVADGFTYATMKVFLSMKFRIFLLMRCLVVVF